MNKTYRPMTKAEKNQRREAILRDLRSMTPIAVAEKHGVTPARVRQIAAEER